jgi:hypothetical protein
MIIDSSIVFLMITCALAGLVYGYSFVLQQRSVFLKPNSARAITFFIIRLLTGIAMGSYLLQSPMIPSILGLLTFTIIFWAIILLTAKAKLYDAWH